MPSVCLALTDKELITVRAGFEARRDAMLTTAVAHNALALFYLNKEVEKANRMVIDSCEKWLSLENTVSLIDQKGMDDFYWSGNEICRIYVL